MPNQKTLISLLAAFLGTIVIAVAALVITLVALTSGTGTNGISGYAGGVSLRIVNFLAMAVLVVFLALFCMFRRPFK
jgi:hypothetical protein